MNTALMSSRAGAARCEPDVGIDEAEAAAAGFLARYSGRTLEAYRHDLRTFFEWVTGHGLAVLAVERSHLEMYRMALEDRGLARRRRWIAG